MNRYSVCCQGEKCKADDFFRADGRCVCSVCGRPYSKHPHCANSPLPDSMQSSSVTTFYFLNVLCNGDHVKL